MIRRTTTLPSRALVIALLTIAAGAAYWYWKNMPASGTDLSGTWILTNHVTASDLKRYKGDRHEFTIQVTQEGETLLGNGEQTGYNNKAARNRYPIWFTNATVNGDQIVVKYAMKGGRPTEGTFTLQIDPNAPHILRGSFTSTAANTTGTTEVRVVR